MDATRKRLLFYLLLNGLVSACVTIGVLFVHDRYYRPVSQPAAYASQPTQVASQPVSPTGAAAQNIEISAIVGAGIPASETVILHNNTAAEVDLKDWKLQGQEATYTFADVALPPGSSVQLHTLAGQDTLIDLYWGLTAPVWRSGETVTLYDPNGAVRFAYQVP